MALALGRTDREVLGRTSTDVASVSLGNAGSWERVLRRDSLDLVRSTRPRAKPLVAMPTVLKAQSYTNTQMISRFAIQVISGG